MGGEEAAASVAFWVELLNLLLLRPERPVKGSRATFFAGDSLSLLLPGALPNTEDLRGSGDAGAGAGVKVVGRFVFWKENFSKPGESSSAAAVEFAGVGVVGRNFITVSSSFSSVMINTVLINVCDGWKG